MCVCVRERERERECVCVRERKRERVCVCVGSVGVCACVHACVTGRWGVVEGHQSEQAVLFFIATDNKPQSINAIQKKRGK